MNLDKQAYSIATQLLHWFNILCRNEGVDPLPCLEAHSKVALKRGAGYIRSMLPRFKESKQKTCLEGLLSIAFDYCDTP